MAEVEFFITPPPPDEEKKPKKPAEPAPKKAEAPKSDVIISTPAQAAVAKSRPVHERRDDPGALLQGLLGMMPGTTPQMAEGLAQSALNAGHNAVVEGRRIQKRALKNLRRKQEQQRQSKRRRHR